MRRASLTHWQDGDWWFVSQWSGSLFRSTQAPRCAEGLDVPQKVEDALAICEKPYSCRWSPNFGEQRSNLPIDKRLDRIARLFLLLGNERFFIATALAGYGLGIFETTRQAFAEISRIPGLSWADDTCLQRSLLAAMTSKSFAPLGVLFIGADLSTGEMHAWIIENREQPDPEDRYWINFRPLLALYK